jgi:cytochrome c oxidase cbb3-type subunit III
MRYGSRFLIVLVLLCVSVLLVSCDREKRTLRHSIQAASLSSDSIQVSGLHPGGEAPAVAGPPALYQESAYAVSEGQHLFEQYNCSGCHSHGGGGMAPPLMDNQWIYGSEPQNIVATIMQGRPNGMPSWRGRIPEYQAWEIAAYVRSLSGLLPKDVAPGRSDHMNAGLSPQSTPLQQPSGVTGAGKEPK